METIRRAMSAEQWGVYSRKGVLLAVRRSRFEASRWAVKWMARPYELRRIQ